MQETFIISTLCINTCMHINTCSPDIQYSMTIYRKKTLQNDWSTLFAPAAINYKADDILIVIYLKDGAGGNVSYVQSTFELQYSTMNLFLAHNTDSGVVYDQISLCSLIIETLSRPHRSAISGKQQEYQKKTGGCCMGSRSGTKTPW